MSATNFYRAFEDRHRGSRALIISRLEAYLPFITPFHSLSPPAAAIDLGCGRGEWMELIAKHGFLPKGVDLDDGMLAACRERGLQAIKGNAVEYLKGLGDESQCIVSGFHIVEHIAFAELDSIVVEALRVLKPGGLLILETPNPENITVGSNTFYLDPTHTRPIPPLLLSFVAEYRGFSRVKTVRLQESPVFRDLSSKIGLLQVLEGVSPDYAIVAQKAAKPALLAKFDMAFQASYGIGLAELANRLEERLSSLEAHEAERIALLASLSWRSTAPLRWVAHQMGAIAQKGELVARQVVSAPVRMLRNVLAAPMRSVLREPALAQRVNKTLMRFPRLHQRLRGFAIRVGVMNSEAARDPSSSAHTPLDRSNLTPRAREIYDELKHASELPGERRS